MVVQAAFAAAQPFAGLSQRVGVSMPMIGQRTRAMGSPPPSSRARMMCMPAVATTADASEAAEGGRSAGLAATAARVTKSLAKATWCVPPHRGRQSPKTPHHPLQEPPVTPHHPPVLLSSSPPLLFSPLLLSRPSSSFLLPLFTGPSAPLFQVPPHPLGHAVLPLLGLDAAEACCRPHPQGYRTPARCR